MSFLENIVSKGHLNSYYLHGVRLILPLQVWMFNGCVQQRWMFVRCHPEHIVLVYYCDLGEDQIQFYCKLMQETS